MERLYTAPRPRMIGGTLCILEQAGRDEPHHLVGGDTGPERESECLKITEFPGEVGARPVLLVQGHDEFEPVASSKLSDSSAHSKQAVKMGVSSPPTSPSHPHSLPREEPASCPRS